MKRKLNKTFQTIIILILLLFGYLLYSAPVQAYKCKLVQTGTSADSYKCQIDLNDCPGGNLPKSCGDIFRDTGSCPTEDQACTPKGPGQSTPPQQNPIPQGSGVPIDLNQLINSMGSKTFNSSTTLGLIISIALPFLYALAGIGLLLMLILGGFNYLTSAGDPKKTEAAKNIITMAVIGFVIVVIAFWLTQIVQYVFGLKSPGGQGLF